MYILGISSFYHDSAAALIQDEFVVAAAQEERFTRKKHDASFPINAIKFCLNEANISLKHVDYFVFYEKPFLKFERLLITYLTEAPRGLKSFLAAIPIWLKEKLFLKRLLVHELQKIEDLTKAEIVDKLRFAEHHQSHAGSAFYPSPFKEAAILTIDGVGEWTTTSLAFGKGNKIEFLSEIHFPHSLGLLYAAFTYYLGFKVNSGEYKVMGLAPYGKPERYAGLIKDNLVDIKDDGSFRLNMEYFNFTVGLTMVNEKFERLFKKKRRIPEAKLTQEDMDIAASIQSVTNEIIVKLAKHARKETGSKNLALAGGVALNCVSNGKILEENIFRNIWIQPAAGDAGGALGAAYCFYYEELNKKRTICDDGTDKMRGAFLGPKFSDEEVKKCLDKFNAVYHIANGEDRILETVAKALDEGKVVGWHQGRMEFGPRALGSRSILGDARNPEMQSKMNLKIKFRESFRPFAPSVLREKAGDYFVINNTYSPYMLLVTPVTEDVKIPTTEEHGRLFGIERLNIPRSKIPAVTHVDYSARVQTVTEETNPRYYRLIKKFEELTGCPVIVNTSLNVRGEPIVNTPEESYRCFMRTDMDILIIEDFILYKEEQPEFKDKGNWTEEFELD